MPDPLQPSPGVAAAYGHCSRLRRAGNHELHRWQVQTSAMRRGWRALLGAAGRWPPQAGAYAPAGLSWPGGDREPPTRDRTAAAVSASADSSRADGSHAGATAGTFARRACPLMLAQTGKNADLARLAAPVYACGPKSPGFHRAVWGLTSRPPVPVRAFLRVPFSLPARFFPVARLLLVTRRPAFSGSVPSAVAVRSGSPFGFPPGSLSLEQPSH